MSYPPLKGLHVDSMLSETKMKQLDRLLTEVLRQSLLPRRRDSLKARPDGTILDGHHRIKILRDRGIDVDSLPREIVPCGGGSD